MNRTFTGVILCLLNMAVHAQVIYGENGLNQHKSSISHAVYVQLASFSTEQAATHYQQQLKTRTSFASFVRFSEDFYQVRVGPFFDDASLKRFKKELAPSKKTSQVRNPRAQSAAWFISGQAGGQAMALPASTTVNNGEGFPRPFDNDIYTVKRHPDETTLLGVQIGRYMPLDSFGVSAFSLGVLYQYWFNTDVSGQVVQFSLPQFTNYNYSWRTSSSLLLANGKLNLAEYHLASAFLQGGIGASFHRGHGYTEAALSNVTPRISPQFQSGQTSGFAYILGAGLDFKIDKSIIASFSYQYSKLQALSAGMGIGTWASQTLQLGSAESNALLFSLTYLWDGQPNLSFITT